MSVAGLETCCSNLQEGTCFVRSVISCAAVSCVALRLIIQTDIALFSGVLPIQSRKDPAISTPFDLVISPLLGSPCLGAPH